MNDNTNNGKVVIDLNHSTDARSFKDGELIHREKIEIVEGWIADRVRLIDKLEEDNRSSRSETVFPSRIHGTISVLGSRGSGKTSFLNTIAEKYSYDDNSKIAVLGPIDPTLIEEKGGLLAANGFAIMLTCFRSSYTDKSL